MNTKGEFIDVRSLAAKVENADLGVGHTAIETGLRIWLFKEIEVISRWLLYIERSYV